MQTGYVDHKEAIQKRLKRIEGQARGIQRMVDDDRHCIDILEQLAASTKALQSVAIELLDDHLAHCVADDMSEGGAASDKVHEASAALTRLVRS